MEDEYAEIVLKVAKMLSLSLPNLKFLKESVNQGKLDSSIDAARLYAIQGWLTHLGFCDCQGNITDLQGFQVFINQVQGAIWAYLDSEIINQKLQLVITAPIWLRQEKIRQTEPVFRDLIYSAKKNLWIVNPFFSIDHSSVTSLLQLVASRLQQSDLSVRLLVRSAAPGGREFILPALRMLWHSTPSQRRQSLRAYSLDFSQGTVRQTVHAKTIVRDEEEAYIGSANWTESSLANSVELGLLIEGAVVTEQLIPVLHALTAHAEPILLETL